MLLLLLLLPLTSAYNSFLTSSTLTQYVVNFVADYTNFHFIGKIMTYVTNEPEQTLNNLVFVSNNIASSNISAFIHNIIDKSIKKSMVHVLHIKAINTLIRIYNKCNNPEHAQFTSCVHNIFNSWYYHISNNDILNNYFIKIKYGYPPFVFDIIHISLITKLLYGDTITQILTLINNTYERCLSENCVLHNIIPQFMTQLLIIFEHNNIGSLFDMLLNKIDETTTLPIVLNTILDIMDA